MVFNKGESKGEESPEAKAEEELLDLGIQSLPENIKAVMELKKTRQHPEEGVKQISHAEGPDLWTHCKLAIKLAEFLDVSDEKKADLKLIMLYHDLGKTTPGMDDRPEIKKIQRKELDRGKLYKVARGHALEKTGDVEEGFEANGVKGRKLKAFMLVVKNHMETSLSEMTGPRLVKLFETFGKTDEERKETAELLAFVIQLDKNANSQIEFNEDGELATLKGPNTTGLDFDKIWAKYEEARKEAAGG